MLVSAVALSLFFVLLPVAKPAYAECAASSTVLSFLSYNIHGLSPLATKGGTGDRMSVIGWLAGKYDVVLLQEDFEYHDLLAAEMRHKAGYRGNGMWGEPSLVMMKFLLLPFSLVMPRFSPPYGAGLSTFVPAELVVPGAVVREPYGECAGWLGDGHDCWARKGYLRVRLRTPSAELDVYNTHLEAGSDERSLRSRRRSLLRLARAIERLSEERAVVVGGDLNIDYSRPEDRAMIMEFRARLGLEDSGAGPELAVWRDKAFLLYRSGRGAEISVESAHEATEFVHGDRALSDHPALCARLRLGPRSGC